MAFVHPVTRMNERVNERRRPLKLQNWRAGGRLEVLKEGVVYAHNLQRHSPSDKDL